MARDFAGLKSRAPLADYAADKLTPARAGGYVCPACGSGGGPHGTSALKLYLGGDEPHWVCHKCGKGGDVFALAAAVEGIDENNKAAQYDAVAEWAREPVGGGSARKAPAPKAPARGKAPAPVPEKVMREGRAEIQRAQSDLVAGKNPAALEYMRTRGFEPAELAHWGVGSMIDEYGAVRVVFPMGAPFGAWYRSARAVTDSNAIKYKTTALPDGAAEPLADQLYNYDGARPLWIFEGPTDQLAARILGHQALSCFGVGKAAKIAGVVKARKAEICAPVIIALDADAEGREASETIERLLRGAGVDCIEAGSPYPGGAHDFAEAFCADREAAAAYLEAEAAAAAETVADRAADLKAAQYAEHFDAVGVGYTLEIINHVTQLDDVTDPVPTGIEGLDRALGGGLCEGLTILGAPPSMGKTTLCVQIADHVAAGGRPVLFVTIEQAPRELLAKSFARIARAHGADLWASSILSRRRRNSWGPQFVGALNDAVGEYWDTAGQNVFFMSPKGQPTAQDVAAAAEAVKSWRGVWPVVFVDYLQLMGPGDPHMSERQTVDANVMEMRQLSRDSRAPVLLVSALNRGGNNGAITFESFRESSSIEYSADALCGLQPCGVKKTDQKGTDRDERAARAKSRESYEAARYAEVVRTPMEIKILKNRTCGVPAAPVPVMFDKAAMVFGDRATEDMGDLDEWADLDE